jgi:hypothetical protein
MLYTYKHIIHDFTKMHGYIEHLVLNVWCNPSGNYSINKLHADFIPIVNGVNPKYLKNPIKRIYSICKGLPLQHRRQLKNGFKANNAIEKLCKGEGDSLRYSQIKNFSPELEKALDTFFKNLYSKIPQIKAFKEVCGSIDNYYDNLVGANEKCPFCGITDILTKHHTKRDALDHYLPKDTYPFTSMNPDNLAPICKTCNSSYKSTKSPIRKASGRKRKAFYPFAKNTVKMEIKAKFNTTNILKMTKDDIKLKITNGKYKEQIETWNELFGIEERYAIKLSSNDARVWLDTMLIDFKLNAKTKNKSFAQKMNYFAQNPIADDNFLKIIYFNSCRQMGIL